MAENKGIMLAKSVQKHAGRAKEKILQNLGKVDRTSDEIFDEYLTNFNRQQQNANRLQKEFNNYIRCIRAAQTASKSLMDAIAEIYEPNWCGYDALQAQAQASESLWQDFAHKLGDQVLIPLNTYTGQFPEMKKKVEKRNRKLIDYDGQRHSYQSLQANANKRKDDVKLNKGLQQLDEARRTYEQLNTELHDELPALYESRILFLVTNLQTLFATEQVFHNETAKIYSELEAIVDKLATDSQCGSNALRKTTINAIKSASPVQSPVKQMNNANITNSNNQYQNTNGSANPPSPSSSTQESRLVHNVSSTPEMNANRLVGDESGIKTEQKMADESADAAELDTEDMDKTTTTTVKSQLNSPNANTSNKTTTTTTIEETTIKSLPAAAKATEETKTTEITTTTSLTSTTTKEDVDMNNATATPKATHEPSTAAPSPAAAASAVTTEEEALKKSEQLNGNATANKDTANGNINTATTNNTTTSASTATTTTTTRTTTNGNANTNNTEEGVDNDHAHANKTKLGKDHLINDYDIKQKNSTSNSKKMKIEPPSKNPFGDYDDDHIDVDDDEEIYEVPKDATTTDLPPGVLYRVKATYGYVKEDVDELSFEVGDIIRVIEYEDPEDQEEGWLMGEKEGTNEKGLFPANFTRPI